MRTRTGLLVMAIATAAIVLSGCTSSEVTYVDKGASYTAEQLQALLDRTSVDSVADQPVGKASELRHEALVDLRAQGKAESSAADVITRAFPTSTTAVPVYVERAKYNGTETLILVEAWADPKGRLSARRLWVVDATSGDVLYSASAGSRG